AKLPLADPPLLNRFEKQRLTLNETLSNHEKRLVERLKDWTREISTIVESEDDTKSLFNETDMFIGFSSEETLQSLVIDQYGKNPDLDDDAIIHACKEALISIATSDGIVRTNKSYLKISEGQESEAELQNQIKRFYESDNDLYILQCDPLTVKAGCIRLAKFIIEQYGNELTEKAQRIKSVKRACVIIHFNRQFDKNSTDLFNFMCGWSQVTIENLVSSERSLPLLLNSTISDILNEEFSFEQILSQELLWSNSSNQWQLDIALNQKSLSLHSSFSVALETYVRFLIRKPIAKLLYLLDRYHAITLFFSWDNDTNESNENELFNFWEQIFMNKKIINIDDMLMDPRPNLYSISGNYLNLRFPFSSYFMEQIDQYKKLYNEELDILYEQPENLDENENLRSEIMEVFLEKFSNNILTAIPAMTPTILQVAGNLYFEDFVTISSTNSGYPNESDVKLLLFLFRRSCDNETLNDPIKLHVFWWTSSDALIAELELARMCPSIMELISKEDINDENARFGINLIDQVCKMMLENIMKLKNENADEIIATNDLREWQRQVTNILSLSANIETSSESKTLQFLRICNDLISTQLINISDIVGAINVKREPDPDNQEPDPGNQEPNPDNQEPNSDMVDDINTNTQPELDLNNLENILSQEFVDRILELFENIPSTERIITSQCSFFRRCFDIIPFDSPVRIKLYEILFGREPRVLLGSVLSRALLLEESLQPGIFIQLIQNARATLIRSPTLTAINTALGKSGVDSPIMALCCDVMQNDFFAKWDIKNLVNSYRDAINVLCSQNFELLQLVIAVALLKEFVNYLWSSLESVQNTEMEHMMFNDEIENIDEVIDNINLAMERQSLLIRSLKLYFLRDLYVKGLSLHAYRCYNQYIEAEEAFTPLYKRGQHMQFEQFLNSVSNNLTIGAKMSIIGILITRLYDI
ncbi:10085_t:CDS:2, partial [Racocetra fulgida]